MVVTPTPTADADADGAPFGRIPYGVDKLNVIRAAIAGYAGGAAIVRELVQNADDATSTWLTFRMLPDRLVVQNSSSFSLRDFQAICTIAAGNKRDDESSIGTWGTGFLSVYQLSDHPELHSSGFHLTFDPREDALVPRTSAVRDHTEFHLPWRTRRTEIGDRLDQTSPWTTERIAELRDAMPDEMGRVLLFLRHVRRIALFDGDGDTPLFEALLAQHGSDEAVAGGVRQRWTLTVADRRVSRHVTSVQHWTLYRASVGAHFEQDGTRLKSPDVALAYRVKRPADDADGPPVADGTLEGTIYNYLPTRLATGFPLHVNGDFFPTNNRDAILDDGTARGDWNRRVVARIGRLFADNLARIRDESGSPEAFYDLLPLTPTDVLAPFRDLLDQQAETVPTIRTTDGVWTLVGNVRRVENFHVELWHIAQAHMASIAPQPLRQKVTAWLRDHRSPSLRPEDVLRFIREQVPDGTPIENAHPIVSTRERLERILTYLAARRGSDLGAGPARPGADSLATMLSGVPLCLDTSGRLRAFGQRAPSQADESVRRVLPPELLAQDGTLVLDAGLERDFAPLFGHRLPRLGPISVVTHLARAAPRCHGRPLDEAHPLVRGRERLRAVLDYLAAQRATLAEVDLRPLALCLDEDDVLYRATPGHPESPWLAERGVRALLQDVPGLKFVHQDLSGDARYAEVLRRLGVSDLTPASMAALLGRPTPGGRLLVQTPAIARSAERLCAVYRHFHQHAGSLDGDTVDRLRSLPFVLTQRQRLGSIADPHAPALLPPTVTGETFDDVMQRVELISDTALADGLRSFFKNTLRAQELNRLTYIEQYVVPHYNDRVLTHEARLSLLGLVRDCWPQIEREQVDLVVRLRKARLIRCEDGQYRAASEVYLPSTVLDSLFPHGYAVPHPAYGIVREGLGDADAHRSARRADAPWLQLLHDLHVRTAPDPADLVRSIKQTVGGDARPTEAAIRHVQGVYDLLNTSWETEYRQAAASLSELATLRWLPAENRPGSWHQPAQVYPSSVRGLVGAQEPVLPFRQAGAAFSHFLGLPTEPRPASVVGHLQESAAAGRPIDAAGVYRFLSRHLDDPAVRRALPTLRETAVVFDPTRQRYWRPDRVLLGAFSHEFGRHRLYVTEPGEARPFLAALGVREQYEIQDFAHLLLDVSHGHGTVAALGDEDSRLVSQAWDRLADVLDEADGTETLAWLDSLRETPVVVDQDRRLVCPADAVFDDRADLLARFPDGSIRVAKPSDVRTRTLLAELGVSSLGAIVERRLVRQPASIQAFTALTATLARLGDVFRRLIDHERAEYPDGWESADDLDRVQVFRTGPIEITYVVTPRSGSVETPAEHTPAFLDRSGAFPRLLVWRDGGDDVVTIMARELAQVMNPRLHRSRLSPAIAQILRAGTPDAAHAILDAFDFARPIQATRTVVTPSTESSSVGVSYTDDSADAEPEPAEASRFEPTTPVPPVQPSARLGDDGQAAGPSAVAPSGGPDEAANAVSESATGGQMRLDLEPDAGADVEPANDPDERFYRETTGGSSQKAVVPRQPSGHGRLGLNGRQPGGGSSEGARDFGQSNGTPEVSGDGTQGASDEPVGDGETGIATGAGSIGRNGQAAGPSTGHCTAVTDGIPPFDGEKRPRVPIVPTNWDALRERFGTARRGQADPNDAPTVDSAEGFDADVERRLARRRSPVSQQFGGRPTSVRVTLSGQGRRQGFLPLTRAMRAMLDPNSRRLECRVDDRDRFPLYVDWQEGVLYNQEALTALFDDRQLPAGAILTLERQPANVYRLSWSATPTVLTNVRIAEMGEDGSVAYTVVASMTLPCEVDEGVARADKRLEDTGALFAEATGKKSFFETMCELFDEADGRRLEQDDLFERVSMLRMVSYATIAMLLQERPCFVPEGGGWWRFDPSPGLKAPRRTISIPSPAGPGGGSGPTDASAVPVPARAEQLADLAHALDRLADLAAALNAESAQRDDDGPERFWHAFDRLVTAVERRHWRSRPAPMVVPGSGANRSVLDRGPLEVAVECLADLQRGTATAAIRAQLVELVEELAGSPSDLRTLLVQVEDRVLLDELLRPVLDTFAASIAADRLDAGEALLAVVEQCAGARPVERQHLAEVREALAFAALADESTDPAEQLAGLRVALAASPRSPTIRGRLTLALERLIGPLATAAADHGEDGRWDRAALSLADATTILAQHEGIRAEATGLVDELARVGRRLIDDLESSGVGGGPRQGGIDLLAARAALWTVVSRISGPLSVPDTGRMRSAYYDAASAYVAADDPVRATIVFGLLLQQLQQGEPGARHKEIVADLLERLGGLYDELGLWDDSRAIWRRLQTQAPGDQQRRIAGLASRALNACERKPFALRDARRAFARHLDALLADPLFTLAATPDYLATLVTRAERCSTG